MTHSSGGVLRFPGARPRKVGLFGGSFDPIHTGHLAVARAALRRFHLDELHFIPAGQPPHKGKKMLAAFAHRFAMVALACAEHPHYVVSLAEAGADSTGGHVHYSIDTVHLYRQELGRTARLCFIVGADSFLELPTWRRYEELLDSCDFIVASRPGFRLDPLRLVIPPELLGRPRPGAPADAHTIPLRKTAVHLLPTVASHVSATQIRQRRRRGQSIHGLVPARVEEYILKQALYR